MAVVLNVNLAANSAGMSGLTLPFKQLPRAKDTEYFVKVKLEGCNLAPDVSSIELTCKSDGTATGKIWEGFVSSRYDISSILNLPSDVILYWEII